MCLTKAPEPVTVFGLEVKFPGPGHVRPFVFGTDTSLGLKVAWSGLTAQYPDTIRLGYQRKELSWAPVSVRRKNCGWPATEYTVDVPSFLATIDVTATLREPQSSGATWVQYVATGDAATSLTLRDNIRQILLERLEPEATGVSRYEPDANTPCIKKWLVADRANRKRLLEWMRSNKVGGRPTDLIDGDQFAESRAKAVKDLGIVSPCP